MSKEIAILGAGNGGQALAGDLALRGFSVRLWDLEAFKKSIAPIMENNNTIRVDLMGEPKQAKLAMVGASIEETVKGADIICVSAPSFASEIITKELTPYITPEQTLLYCPGSTGNALAGAKILRENGKQNNVAEFATLPYAARLGDPGTIKIFLLVTKLYTGVFPARNTDRVIKKLMPLFPDAIEAMDSVLESSLNNGNPISHPVPTLLNASRIGLKIPYLFYQDIIPEIARINEKLDEERMQLCDKLGYKRINGAERLYLMGYSPKTDNLYDAYKQSQPFAKIKSPDSLYDRYLLEDVGYGLQIFSQLGNQLSVPTPVCSAVVTLAGSLLGIDFWNERNRTLADMGIEGMDVERLKEYLYNGE